MDRAKQVAIHALKHSQVLRPEIEVAALAWRRRFHAPRDELERRRRALCGHQHRVEPQVERRTGRLRGSQRGDDRAQKIVIVHSGETECALLAAMCFDVTDRDPRDASVAVEDWLRRRRIRHPAIHDAGAECRTPENRRLQHVAVLRHRRGELNDVWLRGIEPELLARDEATRIAILEDERGRGRLDIHRVPIGLEERVLQSRRHRRIIDLERERADGTGQVLRDELERLGNAVLIVLEPPAFERRTTRTEDGLERLRLDDHLLVARCGNERGVHVGLDRRADRLRLHGRSRGPGRSRGDLLRS